MAAQVLMVQGTASSVGKSMLVAALCRILRQDGLRVAPFKAQNMSNNSYVTRGGGEIGRAQVNQAEAAGVEPSTDMNPILLKPESDHRSQIVLNGSPYRSVGAGEYVRVKETLWPAVAAALDRLREQYDAVVIEGAGSPAEINLKDHEIVNMRVARYAGAPVLLAGDIDRGGVFAHLLGTLELLAPEERALVGAMVINKFRGDRALLQPGLRVIEERTGIPFAGVVPYMHDLELPEEDAVALDAFTRRGDAPLDIAVVRLPHISNFDDFDPLAREPDVSLRYVTSAASLGHPDLLILPGTKATIADLLWMRARGLDESVTTLAQEGGAVVGVCGGYQMLGQTITDLDGVESKEARSGGLALLQAETDFKRAKATRQIRGRVAEARGLLAGAAATELEGYEIHMGDTRSVEPAPFQIRDRAGAGNAHPDGNLSADGWILGTYLHGLFANEALRSTMLANLARRRGIERRRPAGGGNRDAGYERLAAAVRAALDMALIRELMQRSRSSRPSRAIA